MLVLLFSIFYFYKVAATQFYKKKHDTKISMVGDTLVVLAMIYDSILILRIIKDSKL
jgi:hypothetical protein